MIIYINQDTHFRLNFENLYLKRINIITERAYLHKRFLSFAHATFIVCVSSYGADTILTVPSAQTHHLCFLLYTSIFPLFPNFTPLLQQIVERSKSC